MGEHWILFAKGGKVSFFYADVYLTVNWWRGGIEIKNNLNDRGGIRSNVWMLKDTAANFFFRPGLTWPLRTTSGISLRVIPAGCIFGHKGPAVFIDSNDENDLLSALAVTNSAAFSACIELQLAAGEAAARSYEVGVIQRTPIPNLSVDHRSTLARLARRGWLLRRNLDTPNENSHAFTLPALLQVSGDSLAARVTAWVEYVQTTNAEIDAIRAEIDDLCFALYDIGEGDRRAIIDGFGTSTGESGEISAGSEEDATEDDADNETDNDNASNSDAASLAAELVSWAVGVAFGRFDLRFAIAARSLPTDPKPFDPLPVCSPAMLIGSDGLPLTFAPVGYPIQFPKSGILVDERGHTDDLTSAAREVFNQVFRATANSWWSDVGALLDPKCHDLGKWLGSGLFEHHLKHYSKGRRKAPVLWQLGVPSGRYSVWLYAHQLTRDSLFQVQNDVVTPKLAHEERQLSSLIQGAGSNPSAKERNDIAEQEAFVEEVRALLDEVKRVAPLWNPMIGDGITLTMAKLWRLVPQQKPWQKELKSKWNELAAGKYDWAHVAMHLWPQRVVPKCATDRSLAIGHGLDDVFWAQANDGKWEPKPIPKRSVDELVRERASVAVQAALKGLTEASVPNGPKARTRRSSS